MVDSSVDTGVDKVLVSTPVADVVVVVPTEEAVVEAPFPVDQVLAPVDEDADADDTSVVAVVPVPPVLEHT